MRRSSMCVCCGGWGLDEGVGGSSVLRIAVRYRVYRDSRYRVEQRSGRAQGRSAQRQCSGSSGSAEESEELLLLLLLLSATITALRGERTAGEGPGNARRVGAVDGGEDGRSATDREAPEHSSTAVVN